MPMLISSPQLAKLLQNYFAASDRSEPTGKTEMCWAVSRKPLQDAEDCVGITRARSQRCEAVENRRFDVYRGGWPWAGRRLGEEGNVCFGKGWNGRGVETQSRWKWEEWMTRGALEAAGLLGMQINPRTAREFA